MSRRERALAAAQRREAEHDQNSADGVERAEHVGVLHAKLERAIAAHGMACEAPRRALGDGAEMLVDITDEVSGDVVLEIANRRRV